MSSLLAIIFGLIQGATEFLPVSSSAHLTIFGYILKLQEKDALPFFLVLHFGTLLALLIFFRKELIKLTIGSVKGDKETYRIILFIVLTTLATGILGLLFKKFVEEAMVSILYPTIFLILTAILLFSTKLIREKDKKVVTMGCLAALFIGVAQGIAVFPGISRSGVTIVSALMVGLSREEAFDYSFLASIPAIFGAFVVEIKGVTDMTSDFGLFSIIIGFFVSFIIGYFSLFFLKGCVIKGKLHYFGIYCLFVSCIGFLIAFH